MKKLICITCLSLLIIGYICPSVENKISGGPGNPIWHVDMRNR
jgi:hypothetical protein